MSKIKLFISTILLVGLFSVPSMSDIRIGLGFADTSVDANGTETLNGSSGGATSNGTNGNSASTSVSADTTVGHLFVEKTFSNGVALGIDYIPGDADISAEQTRTDDDAETAGNNKASANISDHITFYAMAPLGDTPFFIKGGITQLTVVTTETLATGSTYGNKDINGVTAGVGAHFERDSGFFVRVEANVSEYEDMTFTSTATLANTIEADINTAEMRLSVGKTF
jgi:hypothetical protein